MSKQRDVTNQLIERMAERLERARATEDPVERARIAGQVQWYAGWTMRSAVDECREDVEMSWPALSRQLAMGQSTLYDQHVVGGPIIVARPQRSPNKGAGESVINRSPDGQGPLRRAVTALGHMMMAQDAAFQETRTARQLWDAVQNLTGALADTAGSDTPEPLLDAVEAALRAAEELAGEPVYAIENVYEQKVRALLDELKKVRDRDRDLIIVAADAARIRASAAHTTS